MATLVRLEEAQGLSKGGGIPVSQILPAYAELNRRGALFALDTHAGTAKAPVVAAPTTSPEWALINYDPTRTMFVLQAACTLKSGTTGLGLALMMASAIGPQTAVTADYASSVKSALDGSQTRPNVWITNNPTLVGGTPAWAVLEATRVNTIGTDSVGDGLIARVDGLFSAAPGGGAIAMEVVGETGTSALFSVSFIIAMV